MNSKLIPVEPIYGWGWSDGDGSSIEVPAPFDVASGEHWRTGAIASGDFAGWTVALSARHTLWDGAVDITMTDPSGMFSYIGYAMIPVESAAS